MTSPMHSDQPGFWQSRYQSGQTPWDLGQPSPVLVHAYQAYVDLLSRGHMAVLGAGYGHDAGYFGQQGFTVTGFDFAPEAVVAATECYGTWARFVQADLFALPETYRASFEGVIEHTCFCAIRPEQRTAYVQVAADLLQPGGFFLGVFWCHLEWGGPPYRTDPDEIRRLFSPGFEIQHLAPSTQSVPERQGEEWLGIFQRRPRHEITVL